MTGPHEPHLPPEAVFEPTYWRPTADRRLQPSRAVHVPADMRSQAAETLSKVLMPTLTGVLRGQVAPDNIVFDPTDPDVAHGSLYNSRGAIVLFDVEGIGPPKTESSRADDPNDHLHKSPRTLILESLDARQQSISVVGYRSGDARYYRTTGIGLIGRARREKPVLIVGEEATYARSGDSLHARVRRVSDVSMAIQGVVNRVEVFSDADRPFRARRLLSLELLASGEPARAPEEAPGRAPNLSPVPNW